MRHHRPTSRGAFLVLLAAVSLVTAATARAVKEPPVGSAAASKTVPMVFPVVGSARYGDDYGAPRGQGRHAGIDILTTWRSPAVAAEDGTVKFWTTSSRAGCMLYLYGASGTTYLYIHLNNDLTAKRDNRGSCKPGVAYADGLRDGGRVRAGEQIGYNGDSGDAEGTYHLHFEVHPGGGSDVNPYSFLSAAVHLLFPVPASSTKVVTLGLKGVPVSAGGGAMELSVSAVRVWPGGAWAAVPPRVVELTVPPDVQMDREAVPEVAASTRQAVVARPAARVLVFTRPLKATLDTVSGVGGSLVADRIRPG